MARSLQGYGAKLRLREKVAHPYAREWNSLRRSNHRCFGGTGGCTTAPRGVGVMACDYLRLDNHPLPLARPIYGTAWLCVLSPVVAGCHS